MIPRTVLRSALLLVLAALALAACGADEDLDSGEPPATTETSSTAGAETTAPPETATGATTDGEAPPATEGEGPTTAAADDAIVYDVAPDAVVLSLASGGGFVPMEVAATDVPTLVVFGDGRVLRAGPGEPMASMRPIDELRLDEEGMQRLLGAARDAGLLAVDSPDYGSPNVTDLPGTTLAIATAEGEVTHSAYALGYEDESADGLTDEARERRHALSEFLRQATDLETLAGDHLEPARTYTPDEVVLQTFAAMEGATGVQRKPWPVGSVDPPPAEACVTVSGPDAAAVAELLANATADTNWTLSGREFRVVGRAVLPGTAGCS